MYELALFAGAGGGILGGMLCGHTCIGAVEIEEYPRKVLLQRQRDGILPKFPIWDDVTTFRKANPQCEDFFKFLRSIREQLIITGGFPCQDISGATKGAGIDGERSGLWKEYARIINEIQPSRVFVENSPILTSRGLGVVLGDLAEMGYNAKWGVLGGNETLGFCGRKRIWILAGSNGVGLDDRKTQRNRVQKAIYKNKSDEWYGIWSESKRCISFDDWKQLLRSFPFRNGSKVANGMDRAKAVGNGQDPAVVKLAWEMLNA